MKIKQEQQKNCYTLTPTPALPFALLEELSEHQGGNKAGGEVDGVKLSLGREEGWSSPSVLMFAFVSQ